MDDINIRFLGGANEVGRLGMILETDNLCMLFDYGLSPTKPPSYPIESPPVDLTLLTHSHLDHSGMIPWACSRNESQVLSKSITKEISRILQKDSLKIAKVEGYAAPFSNDDIKTAQNSFLDVNLSETRNMDGSKIRFHSAGHIPGSLMFEFSDSQRVLFTGDLNTIDTRLVCGAHPVKCDILIMEATYAGREHPKRSDLEKEFLDKIDEVVTRGGIAIVPSFAVSRSQEIALILVDKGYDVWVDGMSKKITQLFLKYPKELRSEKNLKKTVSSINQIRSDKDRKTALKGEVILTTSGMLDGGPVLKYLNNLKEDTRSAVLLTGYQVNGTNGRMLLDKGKINFYGVVEQINCEAFYFDFSAHAGHSELIEFAKACEPEKIVLFHSDDRTPLIPPLEDFAEVFAPNNGEFLRL